MSMTTAWLTMTALILGLAAMPAWAQPAGTIVVGLLAEPVNLDPLLPGLAIFAIVLALNLVGDALRDVLDPRTPAG